MDVSVANPSEHPVALELLFRHSTEDDPSTRAANALKLLDQGELQAEGLFVLREDGKIIGAMLCVVRPGATALCWPPRIVDGGPASGQDDLVQHVLSHLRRRSVKVAQALLEREELGLAEPLLRNGFAHVSALWYLRHGLDVPPDQLATQGRCSFVRYNDVKPQLFQDALLNSYEGTLDFPELNDVRSIEQIIEGHRADGATHQPELWWLVEHENEPVGVVLLAAPSDAEGWELAYLGVAPHARRRGYGREMTIRTLLEAKRAGTPELTVAVDQRNRPAWELYRRLGFEPFDQREVCLVMP